MLSLVLTHLHMRRGAEEGAQMMARMAALRVQAACEPLPVSAFRRSANRPMLPTLFAAPARRLAA